MAGNLDRIGVLALQGAFAKHCEKLEQLGVSHLQVRYPSQLSQCAGLIIPGGESTTMTQHLLAMDFVEPLRAFAARAPLFGTCAGMILMAGLLDLLDITVERNAYGRQADSFSAPLSFLQHPFQAFFIRAPRITAIHSPAVKVLATHAGEAVCVQQGHHLAASFHPELTNELAIHHYFVELCKEKQSPPRPSPTTPTRSFQTT